MRDSHGRVIRYMRVSVTNKCNLRCQYCSPEVDQAWRIGELIPLKSVEAIVRSAVGLGVDKVRITGGEPLLREGLVSFVARLSAIPGISSLSMTTNGTLLASFAQDLAKAGLMSVNVSLDSVDSREYGLMTGGGSLGEVLSGIAAALEAGLAVKLNAVVEADDPACEARSAAVERYARGIGVGFRKIRRYDSGSPKIDDPEYDRPPSCAESDRIRLLADGRLLACLHSAAALSVDLDHIEESILACVAMKPERGFSATMGPLREIGG